MDTTLRLKRILLPIVALLAVACLWSTPNAQAKDTSWQDAPSENVLVDEHGTGLLPEPDIPSTREKRRGGESETETFEESYRSDAQPWAMGIQLHDQERLGLCWAYSIITCAEYSYAKELYDTAGYTDGIEPLSVGHLMYFMEDRVDDPLGNTAGDDAFNNNLFINGGYAGQTMEFLSTWSGLCTETKAPFSSILDHLVSDETAGLHWDGLPVYDDSLAYDDYCKLQESIVMESYNVNEVKSMIKKHGAGIMTLNSEYLKDTTYYYKLQESTKKPNHAAVIVGWDDTYQFPEEPYNGNPPPDGAWIVQNSWGEDAGDRGFFYASYYSAQDKLYFMDLQAPDAYRFNFQYDGACTGETPSRDKNTNTNPHIDEILPENGTKTANVFTNTTGGRICVEAVGLTEYNDDVVNCTLDIYTDLEDPADPSSGALATSQEVSLDRGGCRFIALEQPAMVDAGSTYSVVFTFENEETYIGVECGDEGSLSAYDVQLDPGQSFIRKSADESWTDMYDLDACFRIKAFANLAVDPTLISLDKSSFTYDGKVHYPDICSSDTRGDDNVTDVDIVYSNPNSKNAGKYSVTVTGKGIWRGSIVLPYTIDKAGNTLKVKAKTAKVKFSKLKKKSQKLAVSKVIKLTNKGQGAITYTKASGNKKITINKKTGKVTIKKGLKKGTYKVKVRVKAAGTANYKASPAKTVTFTIKVKS